MASTDLILVGELAGSTVYATFRRMDEKSYNFTGTAYETTVNANQGDYSYSLTETPANSRFWYAAYPELTDSVTITYWKQLGLGPLYTDNIIGVETRNADGSITETFSSGLLATIDDYKIAHDTTASDDKLTYWLQAATRMIQNYLDLDLTADSRTEYHNGTGFNFLELNARPASVSTITFDPRGTIPVEIDGSDVAYSVNGNIFFVPTSNYAYFPSGYQNILVEYESEGTIEADIKYACIEIVYAMERLNDPNRMITEAVWKDRKTKFSGQLVLDINDPLFGEVRDVLQPYKRIACI